MSKAWYSVRPLPCWWSYQAFFYFHHSVFLTVYLQCFLSLFWWIVLCFYITWKCGQDVFGSFPLVSHCLFSCSFRRISTPFLFLSVSSHLFISSFLASAPLCGTHHVSFTLSSSLHPQLQLWDTAGQERFRKSMVQHYYRNVHAVLFVYDVTCAASFASLTSWVEECRQNSLGHELPRYLPLKGYEIYFWFCKRH